MLVGEIIVGEVFEDFAGLSVGLIIHAQPPLFLHRVALVVEIGLRDPQRAHAVGFQKQRHVQLIGRNALVIIGGVVAGGAVHVAAVHSHQNQVFALAHVFRALEHHVLEQMRESGVSGLLVSRSTS